MKSLRKIFLIISFLPFLSFASIYGSERGFAGGRENGDFERNQGEFHRNEGIYGGYEGIGGAVVYPGYPDGYLLPDAVDPGEDEADAIYRANQHRGE